MKKVCLLILMVSVCSLQAQEYLQDYYMYKREKPTLFDGVLKTTRLKDSVSTAPYVASVKMYDSKGINTLAYHFNHNGDTTRIEQTFSLKKGLEMTVMQEVEKATDTVFLFYDHNHHVRQEIWKFGKTQKTDTTHFLYDKDQRFIAEKTIYYWGKFTDTIIYKNNRIKAILQIDHEYPNDIDSLSFSYNNNHIVQVITHTQPNMSYYNSYYERDQKGNAVKEIIEFFNGKTLHRKHVYTRTFWNDGSAKTSFRKTYKKGKLINTIAYSYAKEGYVRRYVFDDLVKKTSVIEESVFVKNN
jgi:hypothetical protein